MKARAFGERVVVDGVVGNNLGLPGQYFDVETGLFYNYFRDYDPGTGRYVQEDPVGLGGGLNFYLYTKNNALTYFDSIGLKCELIASITIPDLFSQKVSEARYKESDWTIRTDEPLFAAGAKPKKLTKPKKGLAPGPGTWLTFGAARCHAVKTVRIVEGHERKGTKHSWYLCFEPSCFPEGAEVKYYTERVIYDRWQETRQEVSDTRDTIISSHATRAWAKYACNEWLKSLN